MAHRDGYSLFGRQRYLTGSPESLWGEEERNDRNTGVNSGTDEDWSLCRGEGN